jgi:hypothetical protein
MTDQQDLLSHTLDADSAGKAAEEASLKYQTDASWTVVKIAEDSAPLTIQVVARTTYHAAMGGPGRVNPQYSAPQSGLGTPIVVPATGPQGTQVIPTLPGGLRTNEAR